MDEVVERLEHGVAAIGVQRDAVERGEPWPLSAAYGTEPESDWGPKEVLAHVAEMLPFWLAQIDTVIGAGAEPVPFGRVATDPERIGRVGSDRTLPAAELFDRIDAAGTTLVARLATIGAADQLRRGVHPRLGEMAVPQIVERFVVGHLEEHVDQLRDLLARSAERPSTDAGSSTAT